MRNLLTITVVMLSCAATLTGCGDASNSIHQRAAVAGHVTLDGLPVANASIFFLSNTERGQHKSATEIVNGKFSIDADRGPLFGDARVEIYPRLIELAEFESLRAADKTKYVEPKAVNIPVRYGQSSPLTARIASNGDNIFRFSLTSEE